MWKKTCLGLVAVGFAFLMVELVLRFILPELPGYERLVADAADHPERLFPANTQITYNVTGLYHGAGEATLRISSHRFIEPEPQGPTRYRVLFLGGSTTEALYVPEADRWVALLNEPGHLATFNAGQSGANTIDKYFTLKYLTHDQAMRFDLVVLMTAINDFGWLRKFNELGCSLEVAGYPENLRARHINEQRKKEAITSLWQTRTGALIAQAVKRAVASGTIVERYIEAREETRARCGTNVVTLAACSQSQRELHDYQLNARRNLTAINELARSTGAKLLVLSEATCYVAPSASFLVDLRYPLDYDGGVLSLAETQAYFDQLNATYLRAAADLNIPTFDLAGTLAPLVNGPQGGEYMYDSCHYTPAGCRVVARVLGPVLREMLERSRPD